VVFGLLSERSGCGHIYTGMSHSNGSQTVVPLQAAITVLVNQFHSRSSQGKSKENTLVRATIPILVNNFSLKI
jgi:hypothetical protein